MKNVLPAPCFSISNYVPSLSSRSLCEFLVFIGSCIVSYYVFLYTQLGLCLEKIKIFGSALHAARGAGIHNPSF